MNEKSCLDEDALARLSRLGSGWEFVREMIDIFIKSVPPKIEAARSGVQSGDLVAVGRAAHFLKSGAANVGARVVRDIATQMEQLATEKNGNRLLALQQDLEAAFDQARIELEAIRNVKP